jgi:hypothetical protein
MLAGRGEREGGLYNLSPAISVDVECAARSGSAQRVCSSRVQIVGARRILDCSGSYVQRNFGTFM